ncbi:hypothetical protein [Emticicia soli]|uniref:Uncharacterized protein n=1 Tax=Emticicia soli TaxID=2027878 RepID=A0ABW5J5C1_9BACT
MNQNNEDIPLPVVFETATGATEILTEITDQVLSFFSESQILDNIPIVSWAVGALKIKDNYQMYRLRRNCYDFLKAFKDSDDMLLQKYRERIEENSEWAEEFFDTTLAILLEAEKPLKAYMLGKLIVAGSKGLVTHQEFEELSLIIQYGSIPALKALKIYFDSGEPIKNYSDGKLEPLLFSLGVAWRYGSGFNVSELGKKLYAVCFQ